jgi:hypothetical protein
MNVERRVLYIERTFRKPNLTFYKQGITHSRADFVLLQPGTYKDTVTVNIVNSSLVQSSVCPSTEAAKVGV